MFGKIDHQFSQKDQSSIRYSAYHVTATNSRGAGGLSAPTASANLQDTDQTVAASNIATFSSHLVNETRGQFTYSDLKAPPSDPIGPAVSISGVASFGTLSGSPAGRLNRLGEIADNLSYQAGVHAIRVGIDFLYNDDIITFPRSVRGSYAFSSLANFLSGTYNNPGFTQTFANIANRADESQRGVVRAGRMESDSAADLEFGGSLRFAVPAQHRHRYQQRVAARGFRLDTFSVAEDRATRRIRLFL